MSVPKTYLEALAYPVLKQAMEKQMGAWVVVQVNLLTCLKVRKLLDADRFMPSSSFLIARLKVRLVVKGYIQTFGADYFESFPSIFLASLPIEYYNCISLW
ncbi:hypothetical protein ACOSQ3_022450 [Xanthoceras sorbifolium]